MLWKLLLVVGILSRAPSSSMQAMPSNEQKLQTSDHLNISESVTEAKDLKEFSEEIKAKTTQMNDNSSISNVLQVMQMSLNDEDKVMLQNLNGIIEKMPAVKSDGKTREGKSFQDVRLRNAAEALTDEEITEIIKSISFPNDDALTEDSELLKPASESEAEPRSVDKRLADKSIRRNQGYYVIVFTRTEEDHETANAQRHSLPYSRLQILPAKRSANDADAGDDARFISKKSWNTYIRRIMRQLRRGTRKIQRKTRFKSLQEEPTVEDFLQRMSKVA